MGKLIKRIPDLRLLILSLPCSVSRTHVISLGMSPDSTIVLKALPSKLDIKRHSPSILSFTRVIFAKLRIHKFCKNKVSKGAKIRN